MSSNSLLLNYAFMPSSNPITASSQGVNANSLSLEILVTNPSPADPPLFTGITIDIPCEPAGNTSDPGAYLSSTDDLSVNPLKIVIWEMNADGGTISLAPGTDNKIKGINSPIGSVAGSLFVTVEGLTVPVSANGGVVSLTVTESQVVQSPGEAAQTVDVSQTFTLTVWPPDDYVTSFGASPSSVQSDDPVKLSWTPGPQSTGCYFRLSSSDPSQVFDGNPFYPSGSNPISCRTQPLHDEMTTFTLEVWQTSTDGGNDTPQATLSLTVVNFQTGIDDTHVLANQSRTGRLATIYGTTWNAAYCTINQDSIDGTLVANYVPLDTSEQGQPVTILADETTVDLYLVARSQDVNVVPAHAEMPVKISDPVGVTGLKTGGKWAAYAPDGLSVVLVDQVSNSARLLDTDAGGLDGADPITIEGPTSVAIADQGSGSSIALVTASPSGSLTLIDLPAFTLNANSPIDIGTELQAIAVTADGSQAVAVTGWDDNLWVIDVANATASSFSLGTGGYAKCVSTTSDGYALVLVLSDSNTASLARVDMSTQDVVTIPMGDYTQTFAIVGPLIAADPSGSSVAVVVGASSIMVVDYIGETSTTTTDGAPSLPTGVVITPDGKYALVSSWTEGEIVFFDVGEGTVLSTTISNLTNPGSIAISATQGTSAEPAAGVSGIVVGPKGAWWL